MNKTNFFACFVWLWNLASDPKGETQTEDVWEQSDEEEVWT
jgi:hypothetical protein